MHNLEMIDCKKTPYMNFKVLLLATKTHRLISMISGYAIIVRMR